MKLHNHSMHNISMLPSEAKHTFETVHPLQAELRKQPGHAPRRETAFSTACEVLRTAPYPAACAARLEEGNHPAACAARLQRKRSVNRRGAVAVEMAVTCGLVFFFFFAALEMCRVAMMRHAVEHALYEGARQGITPGATAAEVEAKARSVLRTIGIRSADITVTPAAISNSTREVAVQIRMPLDRNLFAPAFFFRGRSIDRTFVMQREGSR